MTFDWNPIGKPTHLKLGFFGGTGTGKTWTAAKVLSQFIREYLPDHQLAMFDTEPAASYIAPMVKEISGKELLVKVSRSFPDLLQFAKDCKAHGKVVGLVDSATHPWRQLCTDYLEAKRSRVKGAGGNPETVKLALSDWSPIKDIWNAFTEMYCFDPVHWCICGREGDVWEMVTDEEGKERSEKTGVKMKTETETGYEPALLIQMILRDYEVVDGDKKKSSVALHIARVVKDRSDMLPAGLESAANPDIEFFRPHIKILDLGGKAVERTITPAFGKEQGLNWETIQREREGLLENVKDDILLVLPGQDADSKRKKVEALRFAFGTSSWTELEKKEKEFPPQRLREGRVKLNEYLKGLKNDKNG